jgi:hypothetical protein
LEITIEAGWKALYKAGVAAEFANKNNEFLRLGAGTDGCG